jgi:hypothetical protein
LDELCISGLCLVVDFLVLDSAYFIAILCILNWNTICKLITGTPHHHKKTHQPFLVILFSTLHSHQGGGWLD